MFQKNTRLDDYLRELNQVLAPSENELVSRFAASGKGIPSVVKIGLPRVGGTLLTQWAACSNGFYLPSNLLSRFYNAPCTGAMITELLRNPAYDYKNEFADINREVEFSSDIGKTSGVLSPHEFWYFWRHKLHVPDIPVGEAEFVEKSDFLAFNQTLNALKAIVGKPVFLKAHLVNFYLPAFAGRADNFVYFHLTRNLLDVAQSLYFARMKWTGSAEQWFSHKPPQYHELIKLSPFHQVAGQVYFIEKAMIESKPYLGDRYFEASYRDLCEKPADVYQGLMQVVQQHADRELPKDYLGEPGFAFSSKPDPAIRGELEKAMEYFFTRYGEIALAP